MKPISTLLPYLMHIDDGVILLKDGRYLAGWHYFGPDRDTLSESDNSHIDNVINRIIASLAGGMSLSVHCIRRSAGDYPSADDCHFSVTAKASHYIDNLRRQATNEVMYTNQYYFFVTADLPSKSDGQAQSFFYTSTSSTNKVTESYLSES